MPFGYRLEETSNTALALGGAVTFLLGYAGGVLIASSEGFENGSGWMLVPVVGPWASIAARENPCRDAVRTVGGVRIVDQGCINDAVDEAFTIVLMTLDGLVHTTGAALFVVGLASHERRLVRKDVAGLRLRPHLFADRAGVELQGAF